jgi:transcriptional regulator with XRE-family HTH domain
MDNRDEVRDFLMTRRANLSPQQAGLPAGSNRRVPGLRRAEVALLADVSIEYYSRIERGDLSGASEAVLHAIGGALQLDDAERQHLFDLARASTPGSVRRARGAPRNPVVRPGLQLILDAVSAGPALVRNGRMDIVAANRLARAMYCDLYPCPDRSPNLARYAFLDREKSDRFYPDWNVAADATVAILRIEAGRDPYDKGMQDLIGELSTRSEEFRTKWGAHNVRRHASGVKNFNHPIVGELNLIFEGAELMADPGLNLLIYTAEPGSRTSEALQLLASWALTHELESATERTARSAESEGAQPR